MSEEGEKKNMCLYDWVATDPPMYQKLIVLLNLYRGLYLKGDNKKMIKPLRRDIIITPQFQVSFSSKSSRQTKREYRTNQQHWLYQNHIYEIPIALNFLAYMIWGKLIDYDEFMKKYPNFDTKNSDIYKFMNACKTRSNEWSKDQFEVALKQLIFKESYKYQNTKVMPKNKKEEIPLILQNLYNIIQSIKDNKLKNYNIENLEKINEKECENDWRVSNAKGIIYQKYGIYDKAQNCYEEALKTSTDQGLIYYNLASLYHLKKQNILYENKLDHLRKLEFRVDVQQYYGNHLVNAKKYGQALLCFENMISKLNKFESIKYRIKKAEIYWLQKYFDLSQKEFIDISTEIQGYLQLIGNQKEQNTRSPSQSPSKQPSKTRNFANESSFSKNPAQTEIYLKQWNKLVKLNLILLSKQLCEGKSPNDYLSKVYDLHKQHNEKSNTLSYAYATALLENGKYTEALTIYFGILPSYKNSYDYLWNVAKCLFETQNDECFIYLNDIKSIDKSKIKFINKTILEIHSYFVYLEQINKKKASPSLENADENRIKQIIAVAKKEEMRE